MAMSIQGRPACYAPPPRWYGWYVCWISERDRRLVPLSLAPRGRSACARP